MTDTDHDQEMALYAARRARLNALLDHFECGAGDWSVQRIGEPPPRGEGMRAPALERLRTEGAPENLPHIGRWAVVTHSTKGHGHFIECILDVADIERVAIANLGFDRHPVCYFDLDALTGPAPAPEDGDEVVLLDGKGGIYHVVGVESERDREMLTLAIRAEGDAVVRIGSDEVEVVRRSDPLTDRRLPLRYDVIRVAADVEFKTKAAEPES